MSGSATFTIVMSSRSMNTPVQTAVRVHHLGSRPDDAVPAPVAVLVSEVMVRPPVARVRGQSITKLTITCGTIRLDP